MRTACTLIVLLAAGTAPAVAPAKTPRVLVTGDSMMQPLDELLERPVARRGGRVVSDPRPGTGITNEVTLDWRKHARRQVRRHRPRATVIFIGANDSHALRTRDGAEVVCCRRAWIDEYARRITAIMRTYRRARGAHVYWLTLPTPREPEHQRRFAAINLAVKRAAEAAGRRAHVLDTVPVLSPGDRFHRRLRHRGKRRVVRDRDGVHLTTAGSRIVADMVSRALRRDGLP